MKLFVPRESHPGETRVALTPETATRLVKLGASVQLERGAGAGMSAPDGAYAQVGVELVGPEAWGQADLVAKVQPPTDEEIGRLREGALLVSFMNPAAHLDQVRRLLERRVTSLAMDLVPRITRAQAMDALSSQATVAGYKAVLLGATHLSKLCPLLMTAAGTIAPAKAVVFGAGVAGLQAIATARRLGCVVEATDIRSAAKEQVESLGARFIEVPGAQDMETAGGYAKEVSEDFLRRQREEVAKRVAEADLVITTAQVPGKRAPVLVSDDMLRAMRPGSVVVDLAVESGGNVQGSVLGQVVEVHGVKVVGLANLPASVPTHASELYSKNVLALVRLMFTKDGQFAPNLEDEVLAGCLLTHAGEVKHAPTQALLAQTGSHA